MDRRRDKEKGATLVEAAIILPILIFVIVTIMELGVAFYNYLTTDFAAKEGARVAALAGDNIDADCLIVQSIVAGYSATDFDKLDSITIFQVSPSGNAVPGKSNVWTFPGNPSDDPFDCADWSKPDPANWLSTDRDVSVGGGSDLDIVGITIDTRHDWITGVPPWRGTIDIARTSIQRLEPEAFE